MQLRYLILSSLVALFALIPASGQMAVTGGVPNDSVSQPVSNLIEMEREDIVSIAMKYIGTRYRYGQTGPKSFDCSGFTSFVYKQRDIALTRTSRTQFGEGEEVADIADLQPGDLVFFGGSRSKDVVGHVGIVTDVDAEGKDFSFVHASRSGVKVDVLSSEYYSKRYLGARRIF